MQNATVFEIVGSNFFFRKQFSIRGLSMRPLIMISLRPKTVCHGDLHGTSAAGSLMGVETADLIRVLFRPVRPGFLRVSPLVDFERDDKPCQQGFGDR